MLAVEFVDYSDRVNELLSRKLQAGMSAAAVTLAKDYRNGLSEEAPPHSRPGQIPHAYLGHKPGGYGPLLGEGEIQNVTFFGFARDQSDYLSSYIHGGGSVSGDSPKGVVGFAESHVADRRKNYLIQHDQGTVPEYPGKRRPWIIPLYRTAKSDMISAFVSKFRDKK